MITVINLTEEDIQSEKMGLNIVVKASDNTWVTFTPDAIKALVDDAKQLGFIGE